MSRRLRPISAQHHAVLLECAWYGRRVVGREIGEDALAAVPSAVGLWFTTVHGDGTGGVARQLEVGAKPFIAVAERQSAVVAIFFVGFILPRLVVIHGKLVREAPCPQASVVHPAFHAVSLCAEMVGLKAS